MQCKWAGIMYGWGWCLFAGWTWGWTYCLVHVWMFVTGTTPLVCVVLYSSSCLVRILTYIVSVDLCFNSVNLLLQTVAVTRMYYSDWCYGINWCLSETDCADCHMTIWTAVSCHKHDSAGGPLVVLSGCVVIFKIFYWGLLYDFSVMCILSSILL